MSAAEYLASVLADQKFDDDDQELKDLRAKRQEVETLLRSSFTSCTPSIRYAGSYAKDTMIRDSYDLDIVCYFDHEDTLAGSSLKQIFDNVHQVLATKYFVQPKTSALHLEEGAETKRYTHVDVVPGRFTDSSRSDAFIFQNGAEKHRLKTNIDTHVSYIRDSGLTDTIRLVKLWRERSGFRAKTFILELLVVDILSGFQKRPLDEQLVHFWEVLRDRIDDLAVRDPANPEGNDLSDLLASQKPALQLAAETALHTVESSGWEAVFGQHRNRVRDAERATLISGIPQRKQQGSRPWSL